MVTFNTYSAVNLNRPAFGMAHAKGSYARYMDDASDLATKYGDYPSILQAYNALLDLNKALDDAKKNQYLTPVELGAVAKAFFDNLPNTDKTDLGTEIRNDTRSSNELVTEVSNAFTRWNGSD